MTDQPHKKIIGLRVHHPRATFNFKIAMLIFLIGFIVLLALIVREFGRVLP